MEAPTGKVVFIYMDPRWPEDVLKALRGDVLSMPAGELLGAVIFADALLSAVPQISHLTIFTDSDATAVSIQSSSSPSPQMNVIVEWLMQRHPHVQFMALHQAGIRNQAADRLSRSDSAGVVAEAAETGALTCHIPLEAHAIDLMRLAVATPQHPRRRQPSQDA